MLIHRYKSARSITTKDVINYIYRTFNQINDKLLKHINYNKYKLNVTIHLDTIEQRNCFIKLYNKVECIFKKKIPG